MAEAANTDRKDEDNPLDAMRDRILDATLPNVLFDGWSRKGLVMGAEMAGLQEGDVDLVFPRGARDAIAHWLYRADREMSAALEAADLDKMKIRAKVAFGVRTRLEQVAPHKEAVRRALGLLALPGNAALGTRALYRTVDAIWYACGDRSTDFNFYSKRGLLAAVYSSTLLYWLDDESDGHEATWAFLDRRVENVMQIPQIKARLGDLGRKLPNPLRFMRAARTARATAKSGS